MPEVKSEAKEMVKEIFDLDKEIDEEFRKTVYETRGFKKGALKDSFTDAVKGWIKEQKRLKKEYRDIEQGRK
ncbi:MAG: hypothetical protein JRN12_03470 [Nitrososphaerota archaeon]|nr:hypothetical protein [Nitrososphaerota archaeon]